MIAQQLAERVGDAALGGTSARLLYEWMTDRLDALDALDGPPRDLYESTWEATIEAQDRAISDAALRARLAQALEAFRLVRATSSPGPIVPRVT